MLTVWIDLLTSRSLPTDVRWVFYEDKCRLPIQTEVRFAFRPRPHAAAEAILRYSCRHLDPRHPIAFVAYTIIDGALIAGLQGDVFTAEEDVYRKDWKVYFDTTVFFDGSKPKMPGCELVSDDATWQRLMREQPHYLTELDYLVSVDALVRQYGFQP